MNAVERAQRFLQNKARAIALTAVPLASLTVLDASPLVLSPGACTSTSSGGGTFSPLTCSDSQLGAGINNVLGIKMVGSGTATGMNGGFLDLLFTVQGSASGSFTGSLPVYYNFSITDAAAIPVNWDVYFSAAGEGNTASDSADGVSTGGTVQGTFYVPFDDTVGDVYEYVLHLNAYENDSVNGDSFTIDIPDSSIDVNPASAPEPAAAGLFGSALAAVGSLAWWRRRRR